MEAVQINHLAVIVAAVSAFFVGGLWYSPILFHKVWMRANNFADTDLEKGHPGVIFGVAFVMSLLIAYTLAFLLGGDSVTWKWGLLIGGLTGVCLATAGVVIIALFERRSALYCAINGGYLTVAFALMGLIIGAWR